LEKFKELADTKKPPYADFIAEFEQIPGLAENQEWIANYRAEKTANG